MSLKKSLNRKNKTYLHEYRNLIFTMLDDGYSYKEIAKSIQNLSNKKTWVSQLYGYTKRYPKGVEKKDDIKINISNKNDLSSVTDSQNITEKKDDIEINISNKNDLSSVTDSQNITEKKDDIRDEAQSKLSNNRGTIFSNLKRDVDVPTSDVDKDKYL